MLPARSEGNSSNVQTDGDLQKAGMKLMKLLGYTANWRQRHPFSICPFEQPRAWVLKVVHSPKRVCPLRNRATLFVFCFCSSANPEEQTQKNTHFGASNSQRKTSHPYCGWTVLISHHLSETLVSDSIPQRKYGNTLANRMVSTMAAFRGARSCWCSAGNENEPSNQWFPVSLAAFHFSFPTSPTSKINMELDVRGVLVQKGLMVNTATHLLVSKPGSKKWTTRFPNVNT